MSWITVVAVLVAWSVIGLGVAYLFGRFIHEVERTGNTSDLPVALVSYLRFGKREPRASSRAPNHAKTRREAVGGRRAH